MTEHITTTYGHRPRTVRVEAWSDGNLKITVSGADRRDLHVYVIATEDKEGPAILLEHGCGVQLKSKGLDDARHHAGHVSHFAEALGEQLVTVLTYCEKTGIKNRVLDEAQRLHDRFVDEY